jgi:hypothetical protein
MPPRLETRGSVVNINKMIIFAIECKHQCIINNHLKPVN